MTVQSDSDIEWSDDTLEINDDGHVEGSAFVGNFIDGYDVSISVTSYDYERNGETRTNHVPHVVVTTTEGKIIVEPTAQDSRNAQKAIENARGCAEYVIKYPSEFIDDL